MFKHPNYYKELAKVRKQFEKEQADKATSNKPTSAQAQADKRPRHKPKGPSSNLPSQEK